MDDLASELFDVNSNLLIALQDIADHPNPENDNENAKAMRAKAEATFGHHRFAGKTARVKLTPEAVEAIMKGGDQMYRVLDAARRRSEPE
jgi:hypothetical protein